VRSNFLDSLAAQTDALKASGLFKSERLITGPQQATIDVRNNGGVSHVLNLCANNYLGLANHPEVIAAAHSALDRYGYGMASVRFICGTQTLHKELEQRISDFLGADDTILYPSCFDANGGLFETILDDTDAVISDALNHASIIDGIRLCKARRFRYQHNDMADLGKQLAAAGDSGARLVVSDGVFSMDGTIADLSAICDLADQHDALTMIDDCHATGFLGATGRGTHEYRGVQGRIDIITGTLGKALGMDLLERDASLREALHANASYFRNKMTERGFDLKPGTHPIIPVMLGDAILATTMADKLLERGVYVVGFAYPVVPEGQARIRTQMSAGLTRQQLDLAVDAFTEVGRELGVINK
jgi:glycine C-acetyltransferase